MNRPSTAEWMDALVSATHELAATSLGYEEGAVVETSSSLPEIRSGSCIALIGERVSLQIGMAASEEDCMKLARSLCGMEPDDEDLSEEDMADALGEIVNVLVGGVKSRMADQATSMNIGLPLMLRGPINVGKKADVAVSVIRWDGAEAQLVLMRQERGD